MDLIKKKLSDSNQKPLESPKHRINKLLHLIYSPSASPSNGAVQDSKFSFITKLSDTNKLMMLYSTLPCVYNEVNPSRLILDNQILVVILGFN